jgi:hypothetical protein
LIKGIRHKLGVGENRQRLRKESELNYGLPPLNFITKQYDLVIY